MVCYYSFLCIFYYFHRNAIGNGFIKNSVTAAAGKRFHRYYNFHHSILPKASKYYIVALILYLPSYNITVMTERNYFKPFVPILGDVNCSERSIR